MRHTLSRLLCSSAMMLCLGMGQFAYAQANADVPGHPTPPEATAPAKAVVPRRSAKTRTASARTPRHKTKTAAKTTATTITDVQRNVNYDARPPVHAQDGTLSGSEWH